MSQLTPCPGCSRHVAANESQCPFCEAPLGARERATETPLPRLGRAAVMAFGAAVATTVTLAACGNAKPPADGTAAADGGWTMTETPDAAAYTPPPVDTSNIAKPYGAPPAAGTKHVV